MTFRRMQIQFQLTEDDYNTFLKRFYFKKELTKRAFLLMLLSVSIGNSSLQGKTFDFSIFVINTLIGAVAIFFLAIIMPFLISKLWLIKALRTKPITGPRMLIIEHDGIFMTSPDKNSFWRWEEVKSADIVNGFLYLTLLKKRYLFIPVNSFSSENELSNFLTALKKGSLKGGQSRERKVRALYYWGLIGIIPNFGAVAGVILAIKGFKYKDTRLVIIGAACILFTVLFWVVIFPLIIP
jgi:hypothetical protein